MTMQEAIKAVYEARKERAIKSGDYPAQVVELGLPLGEMTLEQRQSVAGLLGANTTQDYTAEVYPETVEDWLTLARAVEAARAAKKAKLEAEHQERVRRDTERTRAKLALSDAEFVSAMLSGFDPVVVARRPDFAFDNTETAVKAEYLARWDRLLPLAQAEAKRRNAEAEAERNAEAEAERARAEAKRQERLEWARAHGSPRLVKALEQGYDCRALYEEEYVQHYLPGAAYDWHGEAEAQSRSCPSLAALERVEALRAEHPEWGYEIVWLKAPPPNPPLEAIQINIPEFKQYAYIY